MKRLKPVTIFIIICACLAGGLLLSAFPDVSKKDVRYYKEEEGSLLLDRVPNSYTRPAFKRGSIEQIWYDTKDYDDDLEPMHKYAYVYVPYDYQVTKKYPILYLMHGHNGRAETWLGSPDKPSQTQNCLDHMIQDGVMKPMLVVCMTYYDNNLNEHTRNVDQDLVEPFGYELIDLMKVVESEYSTYASGTDKEGLMEGRDHRIFGGFSMGGVTTNFRICDSMDYFRYFMPLSGTLYWSKISVPDVEFAGDYLAKCIEQEGYGPDDFRIYMATGSKDYALVTMERQVESMKMHDELFRFGDPGDRQVNCTYAIADGELHDAHARMTFFYNIVPVLANEME